MKLEKNYFFSSLALAGLLLSIKAHQKSVLIHMVPHNSD
jgi:hypothetical protein